MFKRNRDLENRVEVLEEQETQRNESPADYLERQYGIDSVAWLMFDAKKSAVEYYRKFDGCFRHNGKTYLITITEDKNNK
jgi:hypothetical protein